MKPILKSGIVAAAFLGLVVAANGATISYTNTLSGTFDFAGSLSLQKFNPALGTLDSVTLTLAGSTFTSLVVSNSSPTTYGSPSSVYNSVDIFLGNSTFDQAVDGLNPNYDSFSLSNAWLEVDSPHFNVANLASGSTKPFSGSNTSASGQPAVAIYTSGAVLGDLTGTGTVPLDFDTTSIVESGISGGATFDAQEVVTGHVTAIATYDYTPTVPEPSSLAVLSLGLGGLVAIMRRRSR